jgi:hypothetical protein
MPPIIRRGAEIEARGAEASGDATMSQVLKIVFILFCAWAILGSFGGLILDLIEAREDFSWIGLRRELRKLLRFMGRLAMELAHIQTKRSK